ncbi:MAG: DUF3037 domain-containing protein, partial [Verrucomicrobiae bacterium]|nr:DUF3037 domain-containing protein [Verrucomicrobiae bacterium]
MAARILRRPDHCRDRRRHRRSGSGLAADGGLPYQAGRRHRRLFPLPYRSQPPVSLEPYSFCFLRYVHEPLSGEFANVGVLLWAPQSRFLGFRASEKFRRLSRFFHG